MKQALAQQGFKGGSRSETEFNQWINSEKKELSLIMKEYDIEWEQLGTHEEHLSVLEFKKQEREKEISVIDETLTQIKNIDKIPVKKNALTSNVTLKESDFDIICSMAKKLLTHISKESKLSKLLKEANAMIQSLKQQLSQALAEIKSYKSIKGQINYSQTQAKLEKSEMKNQIYLNVIKENGLDVPDISKHNKDKKIER